MLQLLNCLHRFAYLSRDSFTIDFFLLSSIYKGHIENHEIFSRKGLMLLKTWLLMDQLLQWKLMSWREISFSRSQWHTYPSFFSLFGVGIDSRNSLRPVVFDFEAKLDDIFGCIECYILFFHPCVELYRFKLVECHCSVRFEASLVH